MIYITGAGCGDFRLLTLMARKVIQEADCILYDRLLDPQIMQFVKPTCECIYVGKRNHHHAMKQDEINRLLVEKGRQYAVVVRLKGGDPYVFGRGSEEARYVHAHGLAFEVIPGVTSAIAGSAYAGIPVTHRGEALGVRIMSAHNKEDEMADLDFDSMANTQDTLVFLMGLSNLTQIVNRLIQAGKAIDTPIALISNGARAQQKSVCGTLDTILDQDLSAIVSPAMIVVGKVVDFHQELNFLEKKPLHGKRYLLATMRWEEAMQWQFQEQGAELETVICAHIENQMGSFDKTQLQTCTHILFTSRNAVICFFEQLFALQLDARALAHVTLCAIGKKTAQVLETYGCRCDLISPIADSDHFAQFMKAQLKPSDTVLLPKANNHHHNLYHAIKHICHIEEIIVYETKKNAFVIEEHPIDGMLFTCSFCVNALMEQVNDWKQIKETTMYAIGEPTRKALQAYGCSHIVTLKKADRNAFLEAILKEESL